MSLYTKSQIEKGLAEQSAKVMVTGLAELSSLARGNTTTVTVSDPVQGGSFTYYPSGYVANNGTVIPALGGGNWVRQYTGAVQAAWFDKTGDISILNTLVSLFDTIELPALSYTGTVTINRDGVELIGQKPHWNGLALTGGTKLGNIVLTGNYNNIHNLGFTNPSGNGISVSTNASSNVIADCLFAVQNHGILVEQYGGSAKDNAVRNCVTYGGIHGFVSKAANTVFDNCTAYGGSSEGFVLASDNITGQGLVSNCTNNILINPQTFTSSFGIKIYSRDLFSTNNADNLLLRDVTIIGGNIQNITSYGILVGDDAAAPGGQTYNEVKNISISGVSISNITGPWAVKFGRCDGVSFSGNNIVGAIDRNLTYAKNVRIGINTVAGGALGNVVYNYVLPVNTDGPTISYGDTYFETANTATTSLTNLVGGKIGQVVTIVLGDDFTTIAKSGQFAISNYIRGKGSMVVLKYKNDGSGWQEIYSRSVAEVQFWGYLADMVIDPTYGKIASTYITGNINTFTFTNLIKNASFKVVLAASGTFTISGWDSRLVWLGGTAITKVVTGTRTVLEFYFDGTNILNIGKSGTEFLGSKGYTPGAIATGTEITTSVTVAGATPGKPALAAFSSDLLGCKISAHCSVADAVLVTIRNDTGSSQTPAPGTLFARTLN